MTESPYDHEQTERDYYDRESDKRLKSCLFSFKAMAILILFFLLLMLLFGCSSVQPPATTSTGTVITVDGERVLVNFPVVTGSYSDQAANWFHIPGHSYKVRDMYPDPCKDPKLDYNCPSKSRY